MLSYETLKLIACLVFPFTCESGISCHCALSAAVHRLLLCKQDLLFLVMPLHTLASSTFHCGQKELCTLVRRDQPQQKMTWVQTNVLLQQPMEI